MRIGVSAVLSPTGGGIYQYSLAMLDAVAAMSTEDDWVVFATEDHPILDEYGHYWEVIGFHTKPHLPVKRFVSQMLGEGMLKQAWKRTKPLLFHKRRIPTLAGRPLSTYTLDLMLHPAPSPLIYDDSVPSIMAIHDLQHRLQPEFPEVSAGGEYEAREHLFRAAARNAVLLIADSETGRDDILNFYAPHGATPDRVKVLPFCPPFYLTRSDEARTSSELTYGGLPELFLFYPAALWPHKNHATLVRALAIARERTGLDMPLVLCGSSGDNLRRETLASVLRLARELHVDRQIRYLQYVPDDQMRLLYEKAAALVMPTFFGPTNIPVYEAWMLECPVVTSDIRGIREQVGDAGLLVDPTSPEALAEALVKVWVDPALRSVLVAKGRARVQRFTPDHFRERLAQILEEAKERVAA